MSPKLIRALPFFAVGCLLIAGAIWYLVKDTQPDTGNVPTTNDERITEIFPGYSELNVQKGEWFDTGQWLGKGGRLNIVPAGGSPMQPFQVKLGSQSFNAEYKDSGELITGTPNGDKVFVINIAATEQQPKFGYRVEVKDHDKIYVRVSPEASVDRLKLRLAVDYDTK